MLERILGQLEPKDLKNAVLVCKHWAKVEYYKEYILDYDFPHFHFLLPCALSLLQFVSGWRGSFPVGLGCPHLGEEEPGSHQLDQVARPEEGPGLPRPQFLLFLALETSIFFAAST